MVTTFDDCYVHTSGADPTASEFTTAYIQRQHGMLWARAFFQRRRHCFKTHYIATRGVANFYSAGVFTHDRTYIHRIGS
jgi:hypothetical protein